jgi:hypothetical protein
MDRSASVLTDGLAEALSGHRCVSGWLGYSEVLFLGFGSESLPERGADGWRPMPPYEVQTHFADWSVAQAERENGPDAERAAAEAAVAGLVGRPVVSWELGEAGSLAVRFDGGLLVRVSPWPESGEAWSLVMPEGRFIAVACDGRAAVGCTDDPVTDLFGSAT